MKTLKGVFAPITTPFQEKQDLDREKLCENIKNYAKTDLSGYLVLGSNGENKALNVMEKLETVKAVTENRADGQTVMVGSIFESTRETIEFAIQAQECGADYITLLPPSYFKNAMRDEVLIRYFTDVASAVSVPCLLYKAPQYAGGVDLTLDLIRECARHENIVGVKDSSSNGIEKLLTCRPKEFVVLSGSANTFFTGLMFGASGGVISLANSLPELVCRLYQSFNDGDMKMALEYNRMMVKANLEISGKAGVGGVKYAMDLCGYHGGIPRLPLLPPNEREQERIRECISELKKFMN